jgi:hypothetical protein
MLKNHIFFCCLLILLYCGIHFVRTTQNPGGDDWDNKAIFPNSLEKMLAKQKHSQPTASKFTKSLEIMLGKDKKEFTKPKQPIFEVKTEKEKLSNLPSSLQKKLEGKSGINPEMPDSLKFMLSKTKPEVLPSSLQKKLEGKSGINPEMPDSLKSMLPKTKQEVLPSSLQKKLEGKSGINPEMPQSLKLKLIKSALIKAGGGGNKGILLIKPKICQ